MGGDCRFFCLCFCTVTYGSSVHFPTADTLGSGLCRYTKLAGKTSSFSLHLLLILPWHIPVQVKTCSLFLLPQKRLLPASLPLIASRSFVVTFKLSLPLQFYPVSGPNWLPPSVKVLAKILHNLFPIKTWSVLNSFPVELSPFHCFQDHYSFLLNNTLAVFFWFLCSFASYSF